MKRYGPFLLILVVLVTALFSLFGDGSFDRLRKLSMSLEEQRTQNSSTRRQLASLEKEIYGLKYDDRELEKAARNELGMARHGELVFVFDNFVEAGE